MELVVGSEPDSVGVTGAYLDGVAAVGFAGAAAVADEGSAAGAAVGSAAVGHSAVAADYSDSGSGIG